MPSLPIRNARLFPLLLLRTAFLPPPSPFRSRYCWPALPSLPHPLAFSPRSSQSTVLITTAGTPHTYSPFTLTQNLTLDGLIFKGNSKNFRSPLFMFCVPPSLAAWSTSLAITCPVRSCTSSPSTSVIGTHFLERCAPGGCFAFCPQRHALPACLGAQRRIQSDRFSLFTFIG